MKVEFTHAFIKAHRKRIISQKRLYKKFKERTRMFEQNPADPILNDHALKGKLDQKRAFSVTGDVRVIYYIHDGTAFFVDIGTHNQVYV